MKIYVAPMEGITGYIFRNALSQIFKEGIDKFYTPFLVPCEKRALSAKERAEVLPENNMGINVVPQILTIDANDFTRIKSELRELGYTEVNLNLGCPSRTVTSKGRGAGALADTDALDRLLDGIFSMPDAEISIKTRIGTEDPSEFEKIMEVYRKYPIKELIVHPRTLCQQYGGKPYIDTFISECFDKPCIEKITDDRKNEMSSSRSIMKICYNGDICSATDYEKIVSIVEEKTGKTKNANMLHAVMIGRGILKNPGLIREITTGVAATNEEIGKFLDILVIEYSRLFSGERPVLFKMKEIWSYLRVRYPECDKEIKKLIKCKSLAEYKVLQKAILR